jgi:prepilin-type N-terminal cleavage/methylation domain-containing protein
MELEEAMCINMNLRQRGFTLIETMVTLLIVSVGMLALGAFYMALIGSESDAQKRLAAVHMAEQLIEDWQKNDNPPTPVCNLLTAGNPLAGQLVIGTPISCKTTAGPDFIFDVLINEQSAQAPVPSNHPNNPNASGPNNTVMGVLLTNPTNAASTPVKVRSVKISWKHKGQSKFVILTSIRKPF